MLVFALDGGDRTRGVDGRGEMQLEPISCDCFFPEWELGLSTGGGGENKVGSPT